MQRNRDMYLLEEWHHCKSINTKKNCLLWLHIQPSFCCNMEPMRWGKLFLPMSLCPNATSLHQQVTITMLDTAPASWLRGFTISNDTSPNVCNGIKAVQIIQWEHIWAASTKYIHVRTNGTRSVITTCTWNVTTNFGEAYLIRFHIVCE